MGAPYKVTIKPEIRRKDESILAAFIGTFLQLIGLRKKKKEIIVVEAKMPISRAKPMTEKAMEKEKRSPQSEGLMPLNKKSSKLKKRPKKVKPKKKPDKKE